MFAYAARYGHQQVPWHELGGMTDTRLIAFNNALYKLIETENKSSSGFNNRFATGG